MILPPTSRKASRIVQNLMCGDFERIFRSRVARSLAGPDRAAITGGRPAGKLHHESTLHRCQREHRGAKIGLGGGQPRSARPTVFAAGCACAVWGSQSWAADPPVTRSGRQFQQNVAVLQQPFEAEPDQIGF